MPLFILIQVMPSLRALEKGSGADLLALNTGSGTDFLVLNYKRFIFILCIILFCVLRSVEYDILCNCSNLYYLAICFNSNILIARCADAIINKVMVKHMLFYNFLCFIFHCFELLIQAEKKMKCDLYKNFLWID